MREQAEALRKAHEALHDINMSPQHDEYDLNTQHTARSVVRADRTAVCLDTAARYGESEGVSRRIWRLVRGLSPVRRRGD
jgi:hypothetical protein